MLQKIRHEDVSVYKRGDHYHLGEDETLSRCLEEFHDYALFTAAAAVYNAAGSLNKAASLLWWAGFWSDEEDLRAWVEDNQERIIARAEIGDLRGR